MEEFGPDPAVEADAARHVLDVGADRLAQIGNLVDEGDLGREKGVGGIFDQLRRPPRGEQQGRLVEVERPVDFPHHLGRILLLGADDDPVRMLEILDRGALAQEFGIGDDPAAHRRRGLADDPLDLVAGADRHRRLGDDHRRTGQRLGDLARGAVDIGKVGMAVAAARRRADGDEDRFGAADAGDEIGGEAQPAAFDVAGDEPVEAGLEDRHDALLERLDLARVLVDADDVVAEIGKAGAGDQPDIAGPDDRDTHGIS